MTASQEVHIDTSEALASLSPAFETGFKEAAATGSSALAYLKFFALGIVLAGTFTGGIWFFEPAPIFTKGAASLSFQSKDAIRLPSAARYVTPGEGSGVGDSNTAQTPASAPARPSAPMISVQ